MTVKKTKKTGTTIILPGKSQTVLYQSNRISEGKYKGFTLMQWKVFVSVIKGLQKEILMSMNNEDYTQLELFNKNSDIIEVGFPLSEITDHNHYKEVYDAAEKLATILVQFKDIKRDGYTSKAPLFAEISRQDKINNKAFLFVTLRKIVAEQVIRIDTSTEIIKPQVTLHNNSIIPAVVKAKPKYFTTYLYEVVMNAKCAYTPKMYMLISSWKSKGGFRRSYEWLREQLGISNDKDEKGNFIEYPEFKTFKAKILIPIQRDLEKKSDCWFNCAADDFVERTGKKVTMINCKIITPEFEEVRTEKADACRQLLRMHAGFSDKHIEQIRPIFSETVDYGFLNNEIIRLIQYVRENKKEINVPQSYIVTALLRRFKLSDQSN